MEKAKEAIIAATYRMLEEGLPVQALTTREIAKRAGVGIGLINYHYQTKEHLLDAALGLYVENFASQLNETARTLNGTAKQKLKNLIKSALDQMTRSPSVTRLAMLRSYEKGDPADFTGMFKSVCAPLIGEITGGDPYWSQLIADLFVFTLEGAFLRGETEKTATGFDFFDDTQRGQFADNVVETVLQDVI